jgi:hypothetical protein
MSGPITLAEVIAAAIFSVVLLYVVYTMPV